MGHAIQRCSNRAAYACCQPVPTSSKLCLSSGSKIRKFRKRKIALAPALPCQAANPVADPWQLNQMSTILEDLVETAIMLDYTEQDVGPWTKYATKKTQKNNSEYYPELLVGSARAGPE